MSRSAASSVPIEQVASCTTAPASRAARCAATAAAVACCSASSVNSQPDTSASPASLTAALRRSSVVSISAVVRSANRDRIAATSATRLASVNG